MNGPWLPAGDRFCYCLAGRGAGGVPVPASDDFSRRDLLIDLVSASMRSHTYCVRFFFDRAAFFAARSRSLLSMRIWRIASFAFTALFLVQRNTAVNTISY